MGLWRNEQIGIGERAGRVSECFTNETRCVKLQAVRSAMEVKMIK